MSTFNGRVSRKRRKSTVFDTASRTFHALALGPNPPMVDGRVFPGFPPYSLPVTQVRALLLRPEYEPETRDAVWAHVIDRARTGAHDWKVACVGLALPALITDFARLTRRFAGDGEDIQIAMVTALLTAVTTVDVTEPWIMQRLRLAARDAGRQALRDLVSSPPPHGDEFESRQPPAPWGHEDFVLARAVSERVITLEEADLIGATRLEDTTLQDYATAHGVSYKACHAARMRAERALRPYLLALIGESSGVGDDGLTDEVDRRLGLAATVTALNATPPVSPGVTGSGWGRAKKPRPHVLKNRPKNRS